MARNRAVILLILALVVACDTASNVDPVHRRQFIRYYGTDGDQFGTDLVVNDDGSMVLLGADLSLQGVVSTFLLKVDPFGNVLWQRQVGGPNETGVDLEVIRSGQHAGELVVVSNIGPLEQSRVRVLKVSQSGAGIDSVVIPFHTQGYQHVARSITSMEQGPGFLVTGYADRLYMTESEPVTETNDNADILAIRVDDALDEFSRVVSKGGELLGSGVRIYEDARNPSDLILFGYSDRPYTTTDFRFNYYFDRVIDGTPIGVQVGTETDIEVLSSVVRAPATHGEGYLMVGSSTTFPSAPADLYVVKYNLSLTYRSIDRKIPLGMNVRSASAAIAPDGYLVLANVTGIDNRGEMRIVKLAADASPIWERSFGTPAGDDSGGAVTSLPDGRIAIVGTIETQVRKKLALIILNGNGGL